MHLHGQGGATEVRATFISGRKLPLCWAMNTSTKSRPRHLLRGHIHNTLSSTFAAGSQVVRTPFSPRIK